MRVSNILGGIYRKLGGILGVFLDNLWGFCGEIASIGGIFE